MFTDITFFRESSIKFGFKKRSENSSPCAGRAGMLDFAGQCPILQVSEFNRRNKNKETSQSFAIIIVRVCI